ncbi:MAG: fructosamine kinase family protein [Leptospirales bacterium]
MKPSPDFNFYTGEVFSRSPLFGGDINRVEKWVCEKGEFAVKSNETAPPDFFEKEVEGLSLLRKSNLPVPEVITYSQKSILLKYYQPARALPENAGRMLANLHSQEANEFGLQTDNFIGSLVQKNGLHKQWGEFYRDHRITFMLDLYRKRSLVSKTDELIWNALLEKIPELTADAKSSLLHGDLWSGNLMYCESGPLFIDPAVYYGDYRVELAFTELFGGFPESFYRGYKEVKPIDEGYEKLKSLYHVYPLLVHANLFGGGYYTSALQKAMQYV